MSGFAKIIVGAVLGGAIVGGTIGFMSGDDPEPGTLALDAVTAYICPGSGEVGTLHRGDRVLITGRSGDWLAVRNVRGSGERVFVSAAAVIPDADLSRLPEVNCEDVGTLTVASSESTVGGDTTTSSSTSTSTSSSTSTSTSTSTTATTVALPSVGSVSADPSAIWEKFNGFPATCPGDGTTAVSTSVAAAAGVQSVTMSWSSSVGSGSMPMAGDGSNYSATLGPFDAEGDPNVPQDGSVTVTVTVTVIDSLGREASNSTPVTLNDCTFG